MQKRENDKTREFMGLLSQNQRSVQRFISYLVPNRLDCEDILQDTLAEMWNKFDGYEEGTNFRAWGIAIARFKVLSHQKKYQKSKFHFTSETLRLLEEASITGMDHEYAEEKKDILRDCLKKLSDKERKYLSFRYESQLTFQGIAEQFGISMQGAYKAISVINARLLKCMRQVMAQRGLR